MNKSIVPIVAGFAVCIALTGLAMPVAGAQTRESEGLEEVIVTARKRVESIQDVPISVSAFTSEQIDALGVTNLSALSDFTPGFSFETFGGRRGAEGDVSRPVIRGQSNILGESNVAIFVDGIIYSESIMSFPFDIIDRVEVLKGPQAAQFGRATFAGAVNIITKRGTNEFENRITARLAEDDDYDVNVSTRGPLIEDRLFYFLHGRYYDYGGEYENELDGRTVGGESSWGLNGGLDLRATDNLTLRFSLGYNEDDDDIPAQRLQDRFANNCFLDQARQYYCGEVKDFDSVRLAVDRLMGEDGLEREVLRTTGTLEWNIGGSGFLLSSNTGFISADSSFGNDQTYLGDPIRFLGGQFVRVEDVDRDEWSTELRIASPGDAAFRYQLGLYYYEREIDRIRRVPGTSTILTNFGTEGVDDSAVFGSLEYDITDRLTAGLELRYQEDQIWLEPATGARLENTFTSTLPRFTLDYKMGDALLYGVAAFGNKPGAINTDPRLPENLRTADEEEAWNYELGVKSDVLDGRLRLNGAVYYIDWTNQQLTQSVIINNLPISVITNAGKTEVWGFELEANARLTDNLTAGLTYAFAQAEFKDFCDPVQGAELTGFDCVAPTGTPGGQVKGNQTPNSPEHQVTANAAYTYPLKSDMDLQLRADYSFMTKKYAQVHNLAYVGDRHLLNLRLGLRTDAWSATLFVDNVLDDRTPSTVVRFADLANLNTGPNENPEQDNVPGTTATERGFLVPLARSRQVGITLTYDF